LTAAGTYTRTITAANGCDSVITLNLVVLPNSAASIDASICDGQSYSFGAQTLTAAGTYTRTITAANGCDSVITLNLVVLPVASNSISASICDGQSFVCGNQSFSTAGTYTITLQAANGCDSIISLSLIILPPVNGSIDADTNLCPGNVTSLTASGGDTYLWSTGETTSIIVVSPSTTTTYSVIIANLNGCADTNTVTINVDTSSQVQIMGSDSQYVCSGISIQLNATGAYSYTWSPITGLNDPNSASPIASPNASTWYRVVGISAQGCISLDSVWVEVVEPVTPVITTLGPFCANQGPVSLQASPGGGTFSGIGVSNSQFNPSSLTAGTYTISYQFVDNFGCSSTTSISVVVNPAPNADAGPDQVICRGSLVNLQASGGASYLWSTGDTTAIITINPSFTSTYWVIATNLEGCNDSDFVEVSVNQSPVLTFQGDTNLCVGESTQIHLFGAATYQWSPLSGVSNPVAANPVLSPLTNTTYTVTGIDSNGCSNTISITIVVNPPFSANAGSDQVYCGSPVNLRATGSIIGLTYQWSNSFTGDSIQVTPSTTTSYIVTATNLSGCSYSDTVIVYVPTAFAGPNQSTCLGGSVQLTGSIAQYPFNGPIQYSWSPSTGLSNPNVANPIASPTLSTIYTLNIITPEGCTLTSNTTVTVSPTPVIQLGSDIVLAPSTSFQLTPATSNINQGRIAAWSYLGSTPNGSLNLSSVINPVFTAASVTSTTTTLWVLTVINPNGCIGTDTIGITVNPSLSGYSISGRLLYDNIEQNPINQGWAYLLNQSGIVDSVALSPAGSYLFVGVSNGNYRLTSRTTKNFGGITTADAALINNYALGLGGLSGFRLQAANVTDAGIPGIILGNDAQQTARRAADLSINNSFGNGGPGDWLHDTVSISISNQGLIQNLKAISFGDVNGSYSPVLRISSPIALEASGYLTLEEIGEFQLPILALEDYQLGSFQFEIELSEFDYLLNAHIPGNDDPLYIHRSGRKVFVGWYSINGKPCKFEKGKPIIILRYRTSPGSKVTETPLGLMLGSGSEMANIAGIVLADAKIGVPAYWKNAPTKSQRLVLYPNPARIGGPLYLSNTLQEGEIVMISIADALGRTLIPEVEFSGLNANKFDLSNLMDKLSPGNYILRSHIKNINSYNFQAQLIPFIIK
jgi:hypothetical protein